LERINFVLGISRSKAYQGDGTSVFTIREDPASEAGKVLPALAS